MLTRSRKRKRDMRLEPSDLVQRPSRIPTSDVLQEWRALNEEYCSKIREVACTMMAKDLVDITVAYLNHEFWYQKCEENLKTGIRGRFFFCLNRWFHRGKMTFEKYCYLSNYVRGTTCILATRGSSYYSWTFDAPGAKMCRVQCRRSPIDKQSMTIYCFAHQQVDSLVQNGSGQFTTKRLEREGCWYSSFADLMRKLSSKETSLCKR
jgi:hypothetical protein